LDYKIYQTKDLVIKSCQKLGKKYLPQIWQAKCEVLANFNNKPNGSKKKTWLSQPNFGYQTIRLYKQ